MTEIEVLCERLQQLRAERLQVARARKRRCGRIMRALQKWAAKQKVAGLEPSSICALGRSIGLKHPDIYIWARYKGHFGKHAKAVAAATGISLELLARPPGTSPERVLNGKIMVAARLLKRHLPVLPSGKVPRLYDKTSIGAALRIAQPLGNGVDRRAGCHSG